VTRQAFMARPSLEATVWAANALANLARHGHHAAVLDAGGVEALVAVLRAGRGLHSFPFPLNLSLPCPFPLNLSLICPSHNPN
jgi:hypothetical protein